MERKGISYAQVPADESQAQPKVLSPLELQTQLLRAVADACRKINKSPDTSGLLKLMDLGRGYELAAVNQVVQSIKKQYVLQGWAVEAREEAESISIYLYQKEGRKVP